MIECTPAEAAALFRSRDTFGMPLGPGQPASLLHALGERDDWEHLDVFGALLLDLYPLFTKPGVRYVSGFFGPAERVLIDSGARIEFVPADFRRFVTIAEQFAPRVVATAAAAGVHSITPSDYQTGTGSRGGTSSTTGASSSTTSLRPNRS